MNEVDKAYAERRATPPTLEPVPEDTVVVWITGAAAAVSILVTLAWLVSLL